MKILFVSLGCDKNLADAESMLGLLASRGYEMTDDEAEADVIVINTCCFINDAKEESVNTILEMAKLKESGRVRALIVSGCMAQRYQEEILSEVPEGDAIVGTASYDEIRAVLDRVLGGGAVQGSLVLVGGAPGIGKSTLMLQICQNLCRFAKVLYVSGEESERQIKLRARRLGVAGDSLYLQAETNLADIPGAVRQPPPPILIVDSLQTLHTADTPPAPGPR